MDLWIRSQDKRKLVKSGYLTIFLSDTNWFIYSDTTTGEPFKIGKYTSEERALEVLDEIQKTIEKHILGQVSTEWNTWYKGTVYEMPQE